ncbi:hypothetical protein GLOIN_2v1614401 [Rhizophagus irregularis DAOM 181602=DAOM 197198]|uniref:Uncharacterized protein n=1 Tax=Rhizophagus irregularis (strain DAOM 181602 / DAOM 197198 / MUCL 43194) TaxID=747089 RepID=A0A2P4PZ44_RHIID|nr:hypothetical protein GLOIN_2v1614401 [Rhizophagus irregularis DAOM 181602=DAOM 197198]POG70640.1 hypothetical protein GLOIN_2v1614401 [Rhizophagus irregularis DAOM 181602=DAOM 197198]|eukprot:XP_025177506.1 hypothetical protein GLOIN_2v1614401 [Rhizophagus irregularis DAOM 181602=DAOM 197198]
MNIQEIRKIQKVKNIQYLILVKFLECMEYLNVQIQKIISLFFRIYIVKNVVKSIQI